MVYLRDLKTEDIDAIDEIFNKQSQFGVPGLDNAIEYASIIKDGEVIGCGSIKLFAEGSLLVDPEISKSDKALAVKEAVRTMINLSRDAGLEILYVIANTESYAQILRNRYGFKAVPGELLMLNLREDE